MVTSGYVILKSSDEIRFSSYGDQGVCHMLALEQGLQDFDGTNWIDIDVGNDKNSFVGK